MADLLLGSANKGYSKNYPVIFKRLTLLKLAYAKSFLPYECAPSLPNTPSSLLWITFSKKESKK